MAQTSLNSTGVASSGALVLQTNGSTTAATFDTAQVATFVKDAVVNGATIGRGAGSVATNTAVGASALNANSTGSNITAVGSGAYALGTASANDAFGQGSMGGGIVTGVSNSAFGRNSLNALTSGTLNTAIGSAAMEVNTTGSNNTAVGRQALTSNTTASNNTAVGYQAGYTKTTGGENTFIGSSAGYSATTGAQNTFVGEDAGSAVTTGSKNAILGSYNGNQGGLNITTLSNFIVLSDGDGNPQVVAYNGGTVSLAGATPKAGTGITFPATQSASSDANTLDDYEEGTWTPVATSQGGSITAYTSSGTYTKIGRLVYLSGIITITTGGTATGLIFIAGYPFANGSSTVTQFGLANETQLTAASYQVRINPSLTTGFIASLAGGAAVYTNTSSYSFSLAYST